MPKLQNDPLVSVSNASDAAAVQGENNAFEGVRGSTSSAHAGVTGINTGQNKGMGIWAASETGEGLHAITNSDSSPAVTALTLNTNGTGPALYAESQGKGRAGLFKGDLEVTGDIRLINADCAEEFDICATDLAEPGTVMVLGEDGKLQQSQKAYDKRVGGVVSGAGDYKPGIVLDKQQSSNTRKAIALLGKVYCKVDAQYGAVEVGDLLTTSPTPGHTMKADDPAKAFGAVIGKALRPLPKGHSLIPILIALQ